MAEYFYYECNSCKTLNRNQIGLTPCLECGSKDVRQVGVNKESQELTQLRADLGKARELSKLDQEQIARYKHIIQEAEKKIAAKSEEIKTLKEKKEK